MGVGCGWEVVYGYKSTRRRTPCIYATRRTRCIPNVIRYDLPVPIPRLNSINHSAILQYLYIYIYIIHISHNLGLVGFSAAIDKTARPSFLPNINVIIIIILRLPLLIINIIIWR